MRVSPESIVDEVICSLSVVILKCQSFSFPDQYNFLLLSRILRSLNHTGICWSSSIPFSEVDLARQGALLYPSLKHNLLTQVHFYILLRSTTCSPRCTSISISEAQLNHLGALLYPSQKHNLPPRCTSLSFSEAQLAPKVHFYILLRSTTRSPRCTSIFISEAQLNHLGALLYPSQKHSLLSQVHFYILLRSITCSPRCTSISIS